MYLHNPRGSNDRLNEANGDRNNANRLFNSQNNAAGGYCYGPAMSYYEGSQLSLEWTNQHGCGGNPNLYCNIVFQYMCGNRNDPPTLLIRDGTTTNEITEDVNGAVATNTNGELLYGMHETYAYHEACSTRQRNMGLWISDREDEGGLSPGRADARFTRQNNNGNRFGYECPEEREYYPYWAPTPWRDIAVLVQDEKFCGFYQSESQNVKGKGYCRDKTVPLTNPKDINSHYAQAPENNPVACSAKGNGVWTVAPSWGLAAPACIKAPFSRDNHLGNGNGGVANTFNWTLPTQKDEGCIAKDNCNCVVRIRYNISAADLGTNGNNPDKNFIDWTKNADASPIHDDQISNQTSVNVQLAMDTTQYGRTFQDRSYVFHIKPRPKGVAPQARIFNLNVRGKRGNIVQVYPAVEYDFVPESLYVRVGDYIHFQWTGCDTNPAGNAGEGTASTDRSNIVQLSSMSANVPATDKWLGSNTPLFQSKWLRARMASLDQVGCQDWETLLANNNNNEDNAKQDVHNCMKLNAAEPYFDGGLIQMNLTGTFYYMSSRNNNFTNRSQKGVIVVDNLLPTWAIAVVCVGAFSFLGSAGVAGAMFYAKSHPHSNVANYLSKM
jgi:hypothetical protein